ncbi:MAG: YeeE/YedE family protein [Bacteroidetes bacterium]|nr:YeeE/YedE family protein [Bacteroidota bacterium]
MRNLKFFLIGLVFGIILIKSQVVSWFRIQEMFRLQGFYMYGVIGSAISVGIVSVLLIKHFKAKTINGEPVEIPKKQFTWGNVWGGFIFGLGWAITGACPGPLYALLGSGFGVIVVTLLSAIFGTWVYGLVRDRLPH